MSIATSTPSIVCRACDQPKQPSCFYADRSRPRGRVARCKDCYRSKQGADRQALPRRKFLEAKSNAARRGFGWGISFDDYVLLFWKATCHYCNRQTDGIDRMNNEPHYGLDNAISCCGRCNAMKGSRPYHEFLTSIATVAAHLLGMQTETFRIDGVS